MHLSDGIVAQPLVLAGFGLVGVGSVGIAIQHALRIDRSGRGDLLAWTGTLAAFVLAVQALNLPVLPGTSAHVIGAALLTLTVGTARSIVAMTAILIVQALLLADGGLTALGINVVNIAVVPSVTMLAIRRTFGTHRLTTVAVVGTALGNALGATSLATALVVGADAPAATTFAWLVGVQGAAGLAEGTLTAIAVRHVHDRAPGLLPTRRERLAAAPLSLDEQLDPSSADSRSTLGWVVLALGVVIALLPWSSRSPEALEHVLGSIASVR